MGKHKMINTRQISRTAVSGICALILLFMLQSVAFGASYPASKVDMGKSGSVTVNILETGTGKSISGGSLTCYPVASLQKKGSVPSFVLTEDFKDTNVDIDTIGSMDSGAQKLAASLADYVKKNQIKGTEKKVGSDGSVKFDELKLGVYLIVQTENAKGHDPVNAFLVTVPLWDGSALHYDVTANPKPGTADPVVTPAPSVTPIPSVTLAPTPTPSETVKPTPTPSESPKESVSPSPTVTPSPSASVSPSPTAKTTPSPTPTSKQKLAQTGQLWWPVPVLLIIGLGVFLLGALVRKKDEE